MKHCAAHRRTLHFTLLHEAEAEFIGKLKIRFRFPAILTQFLV